MTTPKARLESMTDAERRTLRRLVPLLRATNEWPALWVVQIVLVIVLFYCASKADRLPAESGLFVGGVWLASLVVFRLVGALSEGASTAAEDFSWVGKLPTDDGPDTSPKRYDVVNFALGTLNSRIISEYNMVSERTGWLLISQSFLMSAFATMSNNSALCEEHRIFVLQAIALSGLATAALLGAGIALTHRNCERLKSDRERVEQAAWEYGVPPTGIPKGHPVHFIGHLATRALPSLAIAVWGASLFLVHRNVFAGTSRSCAAMAVSHSEPQAKITAAPPPAPPPPAAPVGPRPSVSHCKHSQAARAAGANSTIDSGGGC